MNVENKVIVVTGAGSGMGREITLQLVKKGAKVAMIDINEETLKETENLAGSANVSRHILNITDKDAIEKFPEEIIKEHGQVDGLINNAGIIHKFLKINDLDLNTIEKVISVNFFGTVYMTKAFLPHLLKRPVAHIANVSSMGGFLAIPGQGMYCAAKAGVKVFTEALYSELKGTSVGVTVIHPGAIKTNITTNSGLADMEDDDDGSFKRMAADKAATVMIRAIEKNKFRVMVGQDASFLDKFYRISPRRAVNFIANKMKDMLK